MSGFHGPDPRPVPGSWSGRPLVELPGDLHFVSKSGPAYRFPKGFQSDGATSGLRKWLPDAPRAYLGHDVLRMVKGFPGSLAAALLREMLAYDGVGFAWRWLIWTHERVKGIFSPTGYQWFQPWLTMEIPGDLTSGYVELRRERVEVNASG